MSPARILLVDDEPDMLENCTRILGRQGHTCLTAANGRAALAILEHERPDLLVTDLGIDRKTFHRLINEYDLRR